MLRCFSRTVVLLQTVLLLTVVLLFLSRIADAQTDSAVLPAVESEPLPAVLQVKSGYLGRWYTEADDETRILLLRVSVVNQSSGSLTVSRSDWKLIAEGRDLLAISVPPELRQVSVDMNGKRVGFGDVKTEKLKLGSGQEGSTWLVFKNVPDGNQIPAMTLVCASSDGAEARVDVAATFSERLQLRTSRVGPVDAIALLTINGTLDSINVGALAREIDQLAASQVCRFIIAFGPDAGSPDQNVVSWLRQVALQSGRNPVVNEDFPALPTNVVDLHFVSPGPHSIDPDFVEGEPSGRLEGDSGTGWNAATRNIHRHVSEAVDSAVEPLCGLLPREQLLRSVRSGDALTRASVLKHAGERLASEYLALILSMTDEEHPVVSRAAVFALRYSGSQVAIQALLEIARQNEQSAARRTAAIHSLVESKYAVAHAEVEKLLASDDEFLRVQTAIAVAGSPRPVWKQPLAQLFRQADEGRRVELLPALAAVGHPQMLTLLEECLASEEPRLSATALDLLIARTEPAAERLTSEWVLRHLQMSSPSPELLRFLRRTRDHRTVPLLIKHLSDGTAAKENSDRVELLRTVLAIGDHRVVEKVAGDFEQYTDSEQLLILGALADVHSELFWELTGKLIDQPKASRDRSLGGIVSLLQRESSERATSLLIDLLKQLVVDDSPDSRHLAVVCAALASIGTPDARDALRDVVQNSGAAAVTARQSLERLYQRSPAQRYVVQGASALQAPQQNVTLAMLYLDAAVKTDPELPDARKWRANAALHIEQPSASQLETARSDFARYVELEPDESEGHTGLALVLVRQGNVEKGIATGKAFSSKSDGDSVYSYNMACVYGRAIEQLESRTDSRSPEQQELIEKYRAQALSLLEQSITDGLDRSNLDWMRRDPDLETVRRSPAFKELIDEAIENAEQDGKTEPVEDGE